MTTLELILFGVYLLVAALVQLVLHEGAHAVAARICDATITDFRPWPHFGYDRYGKRRFYFGRVRWLPGDYPIEGGWRAFVMWAPFLVGFTTLSTCALLTLGIQSYWCFPPLAVVTVDLLRGLLQPWWRTYLGDALDGAFSLGLTHWQMRIIGLIGAAIAVAICTLAVLGVLLR